VLNTSQIRPLDIHGAVNQIYAIGAPGINGGLVRGDTAGFAGAARKWKLVHGRRGRGGLLLRGKPWGKQDYRDRNNGEMTWSFSILSQHEQRQTFPSKMPDCTRSRTFWRKNERLLSPQP
jgi:hypothetical protein